MIFYQFNVDFSSKEIFTEDVKHQKWYGTDKGWGDVDDYAKSYNPMLYLNSYFEILSETYYYTRHKMLDSGEIVNQISEKTLKPILLFTLHFYFNSVKLL